MASQKAIIVDGGKLSQIPSADTLVVGGGIDAGAIAAPAVAPAATGRIYFDSTSNKFRVSQNAGAYVDLVTGGTVTSITLTQGSTGLTFSTDGGATFGPSATITTAGTIRFGGTLAVANGGTGVTSLGTGSVAALQVNVGTAGSFVVNGGALGTPSSGTLTNATGLPISGGTTGTLPVNRGGTATTTTPANGQLLIGNGTGYAVANLTAGSGVSIANGAGSIAISATGVTSVGASAPLSSSGGTTPSISLTGTVPVGNGGTGITTTPANGQIPIGNGTTYTAANLTAGSNISISNGVGSVTISATGVPSAVGTVNQLAYFNATSSLTSPPGIGVSSLLWDSTNNRLAIGNPTQPLTKRLEVLGDDALINDVTVGRGGGAVVSNTAIGNSALAAATASATENTAIGRRALLALTTTNSCTAVGFEALGAAVTQPGSTAVGRGALGALTSGANNTAVGYFAGGISLSTGANNSYFGFLAGQRMSSGNNTAVGFGAMGGSTGGAASGCTALGSQALGSLTSGSDNVSIGRDTCFNLATGSQNVAVGSNALGQATSGGNNVAIGFSALIADTVGSNSVAIGFRALDLQNPSVATVMNNVAIGSNSGGALTTGTSNTLIGAESGNSITTGLDNVVIGHDADLSINTDQNSIVIGKSAVGFGTNSVSIGSTLVSTFRFAGAAGGLATGFSGSGLTGNTTINIGHVSATTGNNFMVFAGGGGTRGLISGNGAGGVNFSSISDYRLKSEIQAIENPVDRLLLLHPCSFRMTGSAPEAKRVEGFIAHEVQAVVPEAVNGTKDAVDVEGAPQYQSLDQSRLVPLLTAACQELAAKAQAAEARADAAEARLAALEAAVAALQAR